MRGRHDQRRDRCSSIITVLRAGEQPGATAESKASQGALGRVVRQADPPIVEEAVEGWPAAQHVIDRLSHRGVEAGSSPIRSTIYLSTVMQVYLDC